MDPIILKPAYKHGFGDDLILDIYQNPTATYKQDDGMTIYVGHAPSGALIEVGTITWYGEEAIVHAMPARARYRLR